MKRFLLLSVLFLVAPSLHAQTCTTASCTATTCNRNDVLAALPAPGNTNTNVTVTVPSGTCLWTSQLVYGAPSTLSGTLTVQGQTNCTGSGDPASNNLACTDNTIIQDNDTNGNDNQIMLLANDHGTLRVTGFSFQRGTGSTKNNAILVVRALTAARVDHNRFNQDTGSSGSSNQLQPIGCTNGVADHNIFQNTNGVSGFSLTPYNGQNCGGTDSMPGDHVWNQATSFGGSSFFFAEQNKFANGSDVPASQASDCIAGGKQVFRFNTFSNAGHFQTHPTGAAGFRGCRATELYKNVGTYTTSTNTGMPFFFFSSGPAIVWGNTIPLGYVYAVAFHDCRQTGPNCGYTQQTPPAGWGYATGTSGWDGNVGNGLGGTDSAAYPAVDQPDYGVGDLLSGSFPTRCNSTLGSGTPGGCGSGVFTGAYPRQASEPLYYWLNAYTPCGANCTTTDPVVSYNGKLWTQNVDYYVSSDKNSGADCNGFTGATGVGCGTRASRPATCTTGVAWWSTDQGSWNTSGNGAGNGVLDKCTATNTWTNASYTPYTYPHPLDTTPGVTTQPTISPVSGTVTLSVTISHASSGNIGTVTCYNTTGSPATAGNGTSCAGGSTLYTGAISVTSPETLYAVDGINGDTDSAIVTGTYTLPVATPPTISPKNGTVPLTATVTDTGSFSIMCYSLTAQPAINQSATCPGGTTTISSGGTVSITVAETLYVTAGGTGFSDGPSQATYTASSCPLNLAIGPMTICNAADHDTNATTTSTVAFNPTAGNGVFVFGQFCGASAACHTAPTQTATIGDNINNPESCFVQAPHSPYAFANVNVPDYETIYAWYCPSIPSGVTSITMTTSATAYAVEIDPVEIQTGSIAMSGYFENVDQTQNSGNIANTTAAVSTSGPTVNTNDVVFAMLFTCGASIPATVGTGYTGIIVNPSGTPGTVIEATSVAAPGVQTATTTWSSGSANSACNLGTGGSNDTWVGFIVPMRTVTSVPITTVTTSGGSISGAGTH